MVVIEVYGLIASEEVDAAIASNEDSVGMMKISVYQRNRQVPPVFINWHREAYVRFRIVACRITNVVFVIGAKQISFAIQHEGHVHCTESAPVAANRSGIPLVDAAQIRAAIADVLVAAKKIDLAV